MNRPFVTLWVLARRVALAVAAACGAFVLAILFTPVSDWIINPLLVRSDRSASDAIVLLTAWASPDRLLNDPGLRRTVEAARLFREKVATTIVVTGRNRSEGSGPTAEIMAGLLVEMGVPREAIVLETESTTTRESAVNVARVARDKGWKSVTVVSDAIDMRRAVAAFRHEGLTARAGADVRLALRSPPGFYRLSQVEAAMHEWAGLAYYWSMGWL